MEEKKFFSTRNVTYLAVLIALVIVFQALAGVIKIGTASLCLVLIPIVLGGTILGVRAGAFLGFAFGTMVVIIALSGTSPLFLYMINDKPVFTVLSFLVRGVAVGVIPALLYKLVSKKNDKAAVFVAAAAAPIVNTGIFILTALIMSGAVMDIAATGAFDIAVDGRSAFYVIVVGIVGFNFFIEFALNLVLAPAVFTIAKVVKRRRSYK